MNMKKIVGIIIVLSIVALTGLCTAGWYSSSPVQGLDGVTIRAGSPYAFEMTNPHGGDPMGFCRVLLFVRQDGEIREIPVHGYFYQNRERTQVVYSIWIPRDIPTGEYALEFSIQERTWITIPIYMEDGRVIHYEGFYGPWKEGYSLSYDVVVLTPPEDTSYGVGSCTTTEFGKIDGVENLDAGQRAVLQATLADELAQRGIS